MVSRASTRTRRILYVCASLICLAALLCKSISIFAANPIQVENAKAGTTAWQLTNPATNREIEGYASLTSVNRGGQISLFVNTAEPSYTINIFRMGWYGGAGGRLVAGPIPRTGTAQTIPAADPATGLLDCNWTAPYVLSIPNSADPTDWASGIYLAQLTAGTSGKQSYIIFVVRDDARASNYLFQSSVTTYQAYNNWGGKSLYSFNSAGSAARKVSFNRPYAMGQDPGHAAGMGAGEFLTNLSIPAGSAVSKAGWECNMLRFLEREGYDVTYCTNLDTHADPNSLLIHKGFLSVGHDEYWTAQMRASVESARDHGVSLGFFSADACFWQIRLEASAATGAANRTIVGYKDFALTEDPLALDGNPANDSLITRRWRETPVNRPEDALIGVMYDYDPVNADMVISNAGHWVCAGTGLVNGSALPGLVGYEVDKFYGNAPANTVLIAHSPHTGGTKFSDMSVYTAASGATVFAVGSMQWNWGLDNYNAPSLRPALQSTAAQQMTRNVLAAFLNAPAPAPLPPTSLNDDFNDNARDTAKWNFGAVQAGAGSWDLGLPVLEQNQRLEIAPRAGQSGNHYDGYVSASPWDLTDASASVEVVQVASGGSADTYLALCIDGQNFYTMIVEGGQLYFQQKVGGVKSTTAVAYSATVHRFWRIRHDQAADTIVFETSPSGATWTAQRTVPRQLPLTALKIEMSAGTYEPVTAPGTAVFDNFRLDPNHPNQLPTANPGGPYTGTAGVAVAFNGTGSSDPDGTITSYQWSFGDGGTGSGATPSHTHASAGTYTVTLTVTDNRGGTATATTTAQIAAAAPPPPTSANDDFNDNTRDTAKWSLGGLASPASLDALVTVLEQNQRLEISPRANQSGDHYNGYVSPVTWNLTNANASVSVIQVAGGSADTQMALGIDAFNYALIEQENGRLYFSQVVGGSGTPTSIVYSATQHHFWRIRHDPAADTLVFETSADRTNWTVQRTVARLLPITALKVNLTAGTFEPVPAPGTAIFDDFRIEANGNTPAPNQSPLANAGGPYTGIPGQAVAFNGAGSSDPDGTIASYQWSYGDGSNGTGAAPTHSYAAAGIYTVTLTVTDNRGATASAGSTANISATANQLPVARPGGPYSGTVGQALALNGGSSSDPDGTISGYQWSYGDGGNGTGATPTHSYAAAGTYTVTLTVTDNRGGTASAATTVSITASANQAPVANAGGPYTGTATIAVGFNGGGSFDPDGTIASYQWSFGDGATGTGVTPTHAYAAAGTYTVTLTVTDNRGATRSISTTATIGTAATGSFSGRYVPPSRR